METARNSTAGSAEPYWFEWETGLLSLIEMLDENSDVVAVAFQLRGVKGWDDVGVRFRNGKVVLKQMKHSRTGDRLTFGDLVASSEDKPSLLKSLANAWIEERANWSDEECVLVTNRQAGLRWSGNHPPLADFFSKLGEYLAKNGDVDAIDWAGEDARYEAAWMQFLVELADLDSDQKTAFLRAFRVETGAPDLNELESALFRRLSDLSGLPPRSVTGLFNGIIAGLRRWTCATRRQVEWVSGEILREYLAGEEREPYWLGHCQVETPEPFFQSRNQSVQVLQESLLATSPHKIDFLSAEPGAGKTSCVSKLARAGTLLWKDQCVSIRFYAYKPIQPGIPDVGNDSGAAARPDALWLGLLWQIRERLSASRLLDELRVPAWLDGMPWEIARTHVIRIAEALGQRWGRYFVICIDGIDHAARAQRKGLPGFLESLPSPDAIPQHVRFLLAGQPADAYAEYPVFLRQKHASVIVHPLDVLQDGDLELLWRAANPLIHPTMNQAVLQLLAEKARRKTLPTVYAVESIRFCTEFGEVERLLTERSLGDSISNYYDSIWNATRCSAPDRMRLAAAFSMLRERPTGKIMASGFRNFQRSEGEWTDLMRQLRPLVRETESGFEVLHNDLRVYLDGILSGEPAIKRETASGLADHYREKESDRRFAHWSLLDLLNVAERGIEFADYFDAAWAIEATSLGIGVDQLHRECAAAFAGAVNRREWLLFHAVGCASLTLHRLQECQRFPGGDQFACFEKEIPLFLDVEGEPLAVELWDVGVLSELASACETLGEANAWPRARRVLDQWLGGVPIQSVFRQISTRRSKKHLEIGRSDQIAADLERLGSVSARCGFTPTLNKELEQAESGLLQSFERGWLQGFAAHPNRREALRGWTRLQPLFTETWFATVNESGRRERWGEARALLHRMEACFDQLTSGQLLILGWHAARAKPINLAIWTQPLRQERFGLAVGGTTVATLRVAAQWICYDSVTREPSQVAEDLLPLAKQTDTNKPAAAAAIRLLLRASATIGRLLRYYDRNDFQAAREAVLPTTVKALLTALWCGEPDLSLPHEEFSAPGKIGRTLAEIAWRCGGEYSSIVHAFAKERFPSNLCSDGGGVAFDVLKESGEYAFLIEEVSRHVQETIDQMHELDIDSRTAVAGKLLDYCALLGLTEMASSLRDRLESMRVCYSSHKEWVFQPLAKWFAQVRQQTPETWRTLGMELLELDHISEKQSADNHFGDEVIAEIAAAAIRCGPSDYCALLLRLASRKSKYPLHEMSAAAREGLNIYLRESGAHDTELVLACLAVAIALGRWPSQSALATVRDMASADGMTIDLATTAPFLKALEIAAEIQGTSKCSPQPASTCGIENHITGESANPLEGQQNAEAILGHIVAPTDQNWIRLEDIACLAETARAERHPNRDTMVAAALDALDKSAHPLSRAVEFHNATLIERFQKALNESEMWRLLGLITNVTGGKEAGMGSDIDWAFSIGFNAADLACRARATDEGPVFSTAAFRQLLDMHWSWHSTAASEPLCEVPDAPRSWPDAARKIILSLMQTDACETLYMAMSGLRFLTECWPTQIPTICEEGLASDSTRNVVLSMAQLWALRHPDVIRLALPHFEFLESAALEERLDAWLISAIYCHRTNSNLRNFAIQGHSDVPEITFPGDSRLLEDEAVQDGLQRLNSFARMANIRIERSGWVLGPMDRAFRFMARKFKEGKVVFPPMNLPSPKRFVRDGAAFRKHHPTDNISGDALSYQCGGENWRPSKAAAVRLLLGMGLDPWIASATPNLWPDKATWPSGFDIERHDYGDPLQEPDVDQQLRALVDGPDIDPAHILLGALLRIPTWRRDIEYAFWFEAPSDDKIDGESSMPAILSSGRTFAGILGSWSFAGNHKERCPTVHFTASLIDHPNAELEVTPTDFWTRGFGWSLDQNNPLQFRSSNGKVAAWYERWLGSEERHNRLCRQPILSRWIAKRDSLPSILGDIRNWKRCYHRRSHVLSRIE